MNPYRPLLAAFTLILLTTNSFAQTTYTWVGTNGNWFTSSNWSSSTVPGSTTASDGDIARFNAATAREVNTAFTTANQNHYLGKIFLDTSSGDVTIGAASSSHGTFWLNGDASNVILTNNGTGTLSIRPSNISTGTLSLGLTSATNVINGSGDFTISANLKESVTANLVMQGTGALTLSGNNTYTGGTTIAAGRVFTNSATGLGSGAVSVASGSSLYLSGATVANALTLNGIGWSEAAGNLGALRLESNAAYSGTINLATDARITTHFAGDTGTISGVISGPGGLEKTGAGRLILLGANTYTGGITVAGGTLQVGNGTGTNAIAGAGTLAIASGATAELMFTTNGVIFGRTIESAGTFALRGSGTANQSVYYLNGNNANLTGTVRLGLAGETQGAKAFVGNANSLGTAAVTVNPGSSLVISEGGSFANALTISGNGWSDGGELHGALQFTSVSTGGSWTGPITLAGNARILVNDTWTYSIPSVISGPFRLEKHEGGTLNLGGANTYSGGTLVSAGTLQTQQPNVLGTGAVTVAGGTLNLLTRNQSVGAVTLSGGAINGTSGVLTGTSYALESGTVNAVLGGTAGITKSTTGTVDISSVLTNTGPTAINAGRLGFTASGLPGSGAITVASGGQLWLQGGTVTNSLSLAGIGFTEGAGNLGALRLNGGAIVGGPVSLTGHTRVTAFAAGDTATINGVISGSDFSLEKTGAGRVTLGGSNTYSGGTTISGGTLAIAANNRLPSGSLTVAGGTLDLATFNDSVGAVVLNGGTIDGTTGVLTGTSYDLRSGTVWAGLGGTAGITKSTSGQVTIRSTLTNTGATAVSEGSLYFDGGLPGGGTVTVASGGQFYLHEGTISNSLSINGNGPADGTGALRLSGGAVLNGSVSMTGNSRVTTNALSDTGTINGVISGGFSLTKTGDGTLTLGGANTYSGTTNVNDGTLQIGTATTTGSVASSSIVVATGANLVYQRSGLSPPLAATHTGDGTLRFLGTGVSDQGSFELSGNNTGHSGPIFVGDGSTGARLAINSTNDIGSGAITVLNGAQLYVTAGSYANSLSLSGTGWLETAGLLGALRMESTTWTGPILLKNSSDIHVRTGTATISGVISGLGTSLTKTGGTTLVLSAANTFNGVTNVAGGTLQLTNNLALQNSALNTDGLGTVTLNGPTTPTFGGLTGAADLGTFISAGYGTFVTGLTLNPVSGSSHTYSGVIANGTAGMTLTKTGAGVQILTGANTYTGTTTVSQGTLQIGTATAGGSIASNTITISNGASLVYLRSAPSPNFGADYSGGGTLRFLGTGVSDESAYRMTGANSGRTGSIHLGQSADTQGARLRVDDPSEIGSATVIVNPGSQLYVRGGTYTNSLSLSGSGWSETTGQLGALRLETATWAGTVSLAAPADVHVRGAHTGTISGVISGSFGLEKTGSATLVLSGANSFSGGFTLTDGTVQLGHANALGTNTSRLTVNGTLDLNGFNALKSTLSGSGVITNNAASPSRLVLSDGTYTGTIANGTGALSLEKSGAGTLTLSGNNSFSGGTTISGGGVLALGSSGALGTTGPIAFPNGGGTLRYSAANTTDYSARFDGSGLQARTIDTNGQNVAFAGIIAGTLSSLTKSGTGTLTLSGNNTYTDVTTVNGGTLLINGNQLTAKGAVTVNTGSTLGGTGTTGAAVTAQTGGTLAPGASPGILTTGAVSFASGSTFAVELNGPTAGSHDQLVSLGTVTINANANLNLTLGYVPTNADKLFILKNDSPLAITGQFNGKPDGTQFVIGGYFATINYTGNFNGTTNPLAGGNDIVLSGFQPVPEPTTVLGLAAGCLVLLVCVRSRFALVRATLAK